MSHSVKYVQFNGTIIPLFDALHFTIYIFSLPRRLFAAQIALLSFLSFASFLRVFLLYIKCKFRVDAKMERFLVTFLISARNFSCLMLLAERENSSLSAALPQSQLSASNTSCVPRHCNNYRSKAHFSSLSISMQPDNRRREESFASKMSATLIATRAIFGSS